MLILGCLFIAAFSLNCTKNSYNYAKSHIDNINVASSTYNLSIDYT